MTEPTQPSSPADDATEVVTSIWQVGEPTVDYGELCGNTTACRNMKDVTFEAMVEQGTDLRTAWQEQLARDGKLDRSAGTIGDIVADRR